jgi:glutathione S-transferase
MFIAEKGIEIPTVEVNLGELEQLTDEFKAINPRCTVPVLELDDGTCLNESLAICHYLESEFPEPNLMGNDGREQALVINWQEQVTIEGFLAIAEVFRNRAKGFAGRALTGPENFEQVPELIDRGFRRLEVFMGQLDDQLAKSTHVALDRFTYADIAAWVCVDFSRWIKLEVGERWPNIRRWFDEVSQRPSTQV